MSAPLDRPTRPADGARMLPDLVPDPATDPRTLLLVVGLVAIGVLGFVFWRRRSKAGPQ